MNCLFIPCIVRLSMVAQSELHNLFSFFNYPVAMHLLWMLILVNVLGNCKADDPSFNNKSTSTPEEDSSMENMSVLVSLPCGGGSKTLALSVESACDVYVQAAVKLAGEYVNNRSRGVYRGREWRRMGVNVNIFDDKNGVSFRRKWKSCDLKLEDCIYQTRPVQTMVLMYSVEHDMKVHVQWSLPQRNTLDTKLSVHFPRSHIYCPRSVIYL